MNTAPAPHACSTCRTRLRMLLAIVALAFGALTLIASGRVWFGHDPGYPVFLPLLAYNTGMGLLYLYTGTLIWRDHRHAPGAALGIALLNGLVLAALFLPGPGSVAADASRAAMSLRTGVWFILAFGAWRLGRSHCEAGTSH